MANPYHPGPAPMPSPPPQGYGWPAQPGVPSVQPGMVVGQPNSQPGVQRPAAQRDVLTLVAAGLVVLSPILAIIRMFVQFDDTWLHSWSSLEWIFVLGTPICGAVQALISRNRIAARLTIAASAGLAFIGPFSYVTYLFEDGALPFLLSLLATLLAVAAIVLLYMTSRSSIAQTSAKPSTSAQPLWPQQPQPGPAQAPQWQQPLAQNLQPPTGFPAPQPPAGYAPQPGYQPVGYPQPGFVPQLQQSSAPQQPLYSSPPPQQPAFGAPQPPVADPTILRQPPAPADGQASIPQPLNAFGQAQESGAHPTVLQRPGGFGTPPGSGTPPTSSQEPGSGAQPPAAAQSSSTPAASSASQPPVQAGPAQPGTSTPTPPPATSGQQQPPSPLQ